VLAAEELGDSAAVEESEVAGAVPAEGLDIAQKVFSAYFFENFCFSVAAELLCL